MAYKFNPLTGNLDDYGPVLTGTGTVSAAADGTAALPGIAFTNDLNTGIYRPGADQLALSTNGTGRLFIDASGNVGVGTSSSARSAILTVKAGNQTLQSARGQLSVITSESQAADIGGSIVLGGQSVVSDFAYATLSGRSENSTYAGYLAFGTTSSGGQHSERLRITSAGLVGIGTSSPAYSVDVVGKVFAKDGFRLGTGYSAIDVQTGASGLYLSGAEGATNHVFINPSGRVGIGTTSPEDLLHVAGGGIKLSNNYTISWGLSNVSSRIEGNNSTGTVTLAANNANVFYVNAAERARIDSSGRLLVGTSTSTSVANSAAAVQISGTVANPHSLQLTRTDSPILAFGKTDSSSGSTLGTILFAGNDTNDVNSIGALISAQIDGTIGVDDLPSRLVFSTTADGASSPTERMRIKANGTINFSNVAVYADNAAATTGGLAVGDVYRTSTGQLMIRY